MLLLAQKNLLVHKGRFLLATAGVTCSVVLVLLLMGLYAGWRDNMAAYLRHVRTDLWVGQRGASDLFHSLSLLPAVGEQALRNVAGVEGVSSFVGRLMTCVVRDQERHTFIVGVDGAGNGPVGIVAGRGDLHKGEVVIDQVFARKEGIHLGATLIVAGERLRVVGIARGGNCFLYQYAFVTLAQARRLFGLEGMVNYFLVRLSPTASTDEVAGRIEHASSLVSVFSKDRFISNNLSLTGDNFLPILWVLEVIGLLVGTVVIGLTIYTLTVERSPEYGVLKALGAPDRTLYFTALLQAFACGLLGWLFGVPLSWGVGALAQYFVPQFPAASYPRHALWMLGCILGMSLIAAVLPARRIAR
ncbi:MAG: ABC transporter permease, partial [Deltaproteobacteria bacterium]|nr:ABC transporter permease [Deltaproteobacteria bacterium]